MNNSFSYKIQKSRAQTMVEFALALPILLTLLYGVLETGRLLFIYASTVTAARQAVRYGSTSGISPNGPFYYQDCAGIKAAAQNVGFINRFEEDAIEIWYDTGPQGIVHPQCPGYSPALNGDRVVVSVETQWQPIVPIVPLQPFTIRSQSARTILASISIVVEQPGVPTGAGAGVLKIGAVASQSTYSYVGEIITYTYTLTNVGNGDLSAPYNVQDDVVGSFNCPGGTLARGTSFTCSMTYQITQADLDAGSVTNTATATALAGDTPTSSIFPPGTDTITLTKLPGLTLSKSADPDSSSTIGAIITYTYALENTGNVPLRSPYSVTDDKIPNVNCTSAISPLPVGNTTTCTGTYQLTSTDITNGSVVNNATATATYESADVTSNTATATVITTPLVVWITPSPGTATLPNQVITYTYTVRNNSESAASSLIVTSTRTPSITCSSTSIPVGGTVTCTGTYTVTQADLNVGETILNSASATANGGSLSSNTAQSSVLIVQNQSLSAAVSASPSQPVSPANSIPAGTVITYSYVLTNSGNVTLSSPFSISDDKATITCADQTNLEPNAAPRTCTGTYVVTDEDVAAGSITNTGTASANFGSDAVSSDAVSFTVITFSGARFGLSISANPEAITYSGTSVVFTYTITNTGGITLASPYTITSDLLGTFDCAGASPLAPGASTSCQNSYTTSNTITNTITAATAMDDGTPINSSNLPSITVPSNICTTGSLTLSAPVTNGTVVTWTINNTVGTTLNITAISLTWSTGGNTYLSEIEFPAPTTIWFGSDKDGFQLLSGSWSLPEGTSTLRMTFTKNNPSISDMTLTFDEAMCGPLSNP
jgi:uncharacterized repeat protein (TIGR01451 family)